MLVKSALGSSTREQQKHALFPPFTSSRIQPPPRDSDPFWLPCRPIIRHDDDTDFHYRDPSDGFWRNRGMLQRRRLGAASAADKDNPPYHQDKKQSGKNETADQQRQGEKEKEVRGFLSAVLNPPLPVAPPLPQAVQVPPSFATTDNLEKNSEEQRPATKGSRDEDSGKRGERSSSSQRNQQQKEGQRKQEEEQQQQQVAVSKKQQLIDRFSSDLHDGDDDDVIVEEHKAKDGTGKSTAAAAISSNILVSPPEQTTTTTTTTPPAVRYAEGVHVRYQQNLEDDDDDMEEENSRFEEYENEKERKRENTGREAQGDRGELLDGCREIAVGTEENMDEEADRAVGKVEKTVEQLKEQMHRMTFLQENLNAAAKMRMLSGGDDVGGGVGSQETQSFSCAAATTKTNTTTATTNRFIPPEEMKRDIECLRNALAYMTSLLHQERTVNRAAATAAKGDQKSSAGYTPQRRNSFGGGSSGGGHHSREGVSPLPQDSGILDGSGGHLHRRSSRDYTSHHRDHRDNRNTTALGNTPEDPSMGRRASTSPPPLSTAATTPTPTEGAGAATSASRSLHRHSSARKMSQSHLSSSSPQRIVVHVVRDYETSPDIYPKPTAAALWDQGGHSRQNQHHQQQQPKSSLRRKGSSNVGASIDSSNIPSSTHPGGGRNVRYSSDWSKKGGVSSSGGLHSTSSHGMDRKGSFGSSIMEDIQVASSLEL